MKKVTAVCLRAAVTFLYAWAYPRDSVLKGGISLPAIGYIQVHAYASTAQLPIKGAIISVTGPDGNLLAVRITDESGLISPIPVSVPDEADSRNPDFVGNPFTSVLLRAQFPEYEQIEVDNVQVFAGTVTMQNLEFIPISEFPSQRNQSERFIIPPQNL